MPDLPWPAVSPLRSYGRQWVMVRAFQSSNQLLRELRSWTGASFWKSLVRTP
ncbi:hypothetical protein ABIB34_004178 [Rhodococcus sp. UYP5]